MTLPRVELWESSVVLSMTYAQAGTLLAVLNTTCDAVKGTGDAGTKLLLNLAPLARAFGDVADLLTAAADDKSEGGIILVR